MFHPSTYLLTSPLSWFCDQHKTYSYSTVLNTVIRRKGSKYNSNITSTTTAAATTTTATATATTVATTVATITITVAAAAAAVSNVSDLYTDS